MTQNNHAACRGAKNKTPYGKSSPKTAVALSKAIVYRQRLNDCCFKRFFGKLFHVRRSLPPIKSAIVWLPMLCVLTGCLATPIKPSGYQMDEISTILVVPVESPPLEVIPDLIETRFPVYRQYHYQAMPYYRFMQEKIYKNPGGVLIAGWVSDDDSVQAADLRQIPAAMETSAILETIAPSPEYWTPTFILAQEAVTQLNGARGKALLSKHYYRLPMASEKRNANLENWHNAIEQWYGRNSSSVDYRQLGPEHFDAVLEVGIDKYRIFDAQTSLQVLIKLIDPNTRQVIGRISEKTTSAEDSPQALLSQEAGKFKQTMSGMGAQLIAHGFSELGLAQKVSALDRKPAHSQDDRLSP